MHRRHLLHVEAGSVDVDDIRGKRDKVSGVQDCVLVESAVLGLVEGRLKAGCQEKNLQQINDFVGGGAAQDGDADGLQALDCGELSAQTLPLQEKVVDGKLFNAQRGLLLTSLEHPTPASQAGAPGIVAENRLQGVETRTMRRSARPLANADMRGGQCSRLGVWFGRVLVGAVRFELTTLCSQSGMDENLEEQRVFFRGKLLRGNVLFLL
jgi:hypothetical protein